MNISTEKLNEIKEHASDLLPWMDIAFLTGIDTDTFKAELENTKSEIYKHYRIGIAERKKKLRQPILRMAEHGSPQAELLADKYITEQLIAESDD